MPRLCNTFLINRMPQLCSSNWFLLSSLKLKPEPEHSSGTPWTMRSRIPHDKSLWPPHKMIRSSFSLHRSLQWAPTSAPVITTGPSPCSDIRGWSCGCGSEAAGWAGWARHVLWASNHIMSRQGFWLLEHEVEAATLHKSCPARCCTHSGMQSPGEQKNCSS